MALIVRNFLVLSLLYSKCHGFSIIGETTLRSELLANYSTDVRPTEVTNIEIAFNLLSVQEMNIRDQQLAFAGWFTLVWLDPRLSWDPFSYNNVSDIHTDDDDIWYPVLVIDNAVNTLVPIEDDSIPMRVIHDGTVRWAPPSIVTTNCEMDPTYFPFDKHICYIQVTSFGYTLGELNLTVKGDGMVIDFYQPNGQWKLLSHSASRSQFHHDGHPYSRVLFHLSMKRLPNYHGINLILPLIINSILVPFVFKLSQHSGEKMGYTLTVLLAYTVMLTILADSVPATSIYTSVMDLILRELEESSILNAEDNTVHRRNTPPFQIWNEVYVSIILVMSTSATVLTVFIQNCFFRPTTQEVPNWLLTTTNLMARCICWKTDGESGSTDTEPYQNPGSARTRPTKTPIGWESDQAPSAKTTSDFSWADIAFILDAFCFWVFFIFIVVLTLIVLALLASQY